MPFFIPKYLSTSGVLPNSGMTSVKSPASTGAVVNGSSEHVSSAVPEPKGIFPPVAAVPRWPGGSRPPAPIGLALVDNTNWQA